MNSRRWALLTLTASALAAFSCSSSTPAPTKAGAGAGGDLTSSTSSTSSGATSTSSSSSSSGTTGCGLVPPACVTALAPVANAPFCVGESVVVDCATVTPKLPQELCGVPLAKPASELVRSSGVKQFSGTGPADVGCFTPSGYPPPLGAPASATLKGVAHIFAHGCQSSSVAIEISPVTHACGPNDTTPGAPIGAPVTTSADCTATGVASPNADCGTRYECTFEYPDVPTETELVIKTSGASWAPAYEYGVVLRSTEVSGGVVARDVVAIAADDYQAMVAVALGGAMQAGNGIVLGEVHDCGDVRVSHAVVNVEPPGKGPFYFTSNEATPLPDASATSTGALGLFATFDVPPGPAVVAASGLSEGAATALGFARVRVFPDSVAMIRLKGPLPAGP